MPINNNQAEQDGRKSMKMLGTEGLPNVSNDLPVKLRIWGFGDVEDVVVETQVARGFGQPDELVIRGSGGQR